MFCTVDFPRAHIGNFAQLHNEHKFEISGSIMFRLVDFPRVQHSARLMYMILGDDDIQ